MHCVARIVASQRQLRGRLGGSAGTSRVRVASAGEEEVVGCVECWRAVAPAGGADGEAGASSMFFRAVVTRCVGRAFGSVGGSVAGSFADSGVGSGFCDGLCGGSL